VGRLRLIGGVGASVRVDAPVAGGLPRRLSTSRAGRATGTKRVGLLGRSAVSSDTLLRILTSKRYGRRRTPIPGNFPGPEPSLFGRNKVQRDLKRPLRRGTQGALLRPSTESRSPAGPRAKVVQPSPVDFLLIGWGNDLGAGHRCRLNSSVRKSTRSREKLTS
jgi:hypothetical protein